MFTFADGAAFMLLTTFSLGLAERNTAIRPPSSGAPMDGPLACGRWFAVSVEWSDRYRAFECRENRAGAPVVLDQSNGRTSAGEWLSVGRDDMLLPVDGTERVFSRGFSPRRADILGDIRYLLVRASGGHRSCLGYDGVAER
jgi:hypothetical protein